MKWKNCWLTLRYHLFVGITLIGCVAPWLTPRHFPTHSVPMKTIYEISQPDAIEVVQSQNPILSSSADVWNGQLEVLQNAC